MDGRQRLEFIVYAASCLFYYVVVFFIVVDCFIIVWKVVDDSELDPPTVGCAVESHASGR